MNRQIIFYETREQFKESYSRVKESVSDHEWNTGYVHLFKVCEKHLKAKEEAKEKVIIKKAKK